MEAQIVPNCRLLSALSLYLLAFTYTFLSIRLVFGFVSADFEWQLKPCSVALSCRPSLALSLFTLLDCLPYTSHFVVAAWGRLLLLVFLRSRLGSHFFVVFGAAAAALVTSTSSPTR